MLQIKKIFLVGQEEIMNALIQVVNYQTNSQALNELQLYDAQTSGGLLISAPPHKITGLIK